MKIRGLLWLMGLLPTLTHAQPDSLLPQQFTAPGATVDYLLYLPAGFADSAEQRWPLVLFLHGSGERGQPLDKVKRHGPPRRVVEGASFPFVMIAPQCPAGQYWNPALLKALLNEATKTYRVDTTRIYLTGLSMGGNGTWNTALRYPNLFAAIAPVCGPVPPSLLGNVCRLREVPTWAFHGAKDQVVALSDSETMVARLRDCGNDAQLTVYPNLGHDSWTVTYRNPALYQWLLSHVKE